MREEILAIGELLQTVIIDEDLGNVVDVLAQTARATADGEPDPVKRHRLRWYARQLMRLRAGPQTGPPLGPRVTGAAAVQLALERLMLRVNRMRDLETLTVSEIAWLDALGDGLTHLVNRLPDRTDA